MVFGIFDNRNSADNAVNDLESSGYDPKDISIIMKGEESMEPSTTESMVEGAVSGATTGGVIGGIAGLLIGIGAIAIPGIGGLLIAGPLAAALGLAGAAAATVSGALTGALAGGIVGALVSLGVPEEEARVYEERIKEGAILLAVEAKEGKEDEVEDILEDHGADQVKVISLKEMD